MPTYCIGSVPQLSPHTPVSSREIGGPLSSKHLSDSKAGPPPNSVNSLKAQRAYLVRAIHQLHYQKPLMSSATPRMKSVYTRSARRGSRPAYGATAQLSPLRQLHYALAHYTTPQLNAWQTDWNKYFVRLPGCTRCLAAFVRREGIPCPHCGGRGGPPIGASGRRLKPARLRIRCCGTHTSCDHI